ncbi:MAG: glycosyltransferase family 2 protein [Bryobacteraceae bacterium]|jgi:undecaprenyl-phosphate 4-deoxy-4-formamido-L-arabinose transferase
MDSEVSLSVVVPVYNSEDSLPLLLERLEPVLTARSRTFEVVLVNDGSRDRSWDVICQLTRRYPWVRGISLMRNYGQHNALLCGIRAARNEVIVTLDDDLQNPPEEIPKLLDKLAEGYDVVYGAPQQERHGLWRDLASRVTKIALQSAVGAQTARQASAFRAFRTEVRGGFTNFQGPFVSIDVLLTWGASHFTAVRVQHDARRLGTSQYNLRKLIRHAFNMMTGFSVLPLQIASMIGFVFTVFGFLVLVFVIGSYLIRGGSVPGFPFLASLIAMFSGVQMFALGIIGEYLARMHFRMMDRPGYAIRQQTVAVERAAPRLVAGMHA